MLKVVKEMNLEDFEPWSGAVHQFDILYEMDLLGSLQNEMEIMDEEWTDTQINDFLWFDEDVIAKLLGYDDWEEIEAEYKAINQRYDLESAYDIEIGFDPYMGCYSEDC